MSYPNNIFQSDPVPVKHLVRRERLNSLGRRMLEYQVITVVAPAGYGKTVWVSSMLDTPGWPPAVWVSLDHQDSEPSILLYHLIRSISRDDKADAWRTLMSLKNFENEWTIAASALLDGLPRDRQLLLILDDVHFVYDNKIAVANIEYILDRLPNNIHIVLIARSAPPFKLYKQEIKNQLLRINSKDLLFSEEEARILFSNMELTLSDNDIAALYARTEGWAVGLRLLGVYLQQPGSSVKEALQSLKQENTSFYLYIMNEFLAAMQENLREFLLISSLLPYIEIKLCDVAFGRADSEKMLAIIKDYGLLFPVKEEKGIFRMHNLVEDWLKSIAEKQFAPDAISKVRERALKYFEQCGDIDRAIEQSFLLGRWDKVVELIRKHGNEYYTREHRMESLYKWIEKLPEAIVENDCRLLYFKGMSLLNVDDSRAFEVLSSAADMAVKAGDIKCEAEAIWSMLLPAIFSGNVEKGEKAGQRLLRNPELMTNPVSRKEALAAALQYAMTRDSLPEGLELSRQALKLDLPPEVGIWARYTTGYLFLRVGRLKEARRIIEETLTTPYVLENERRLIVGYEALMDITFIMGDFEALDEACRKCFELGKKYGMLGIMGRAYYLKAHCHYREGRYPEARRDFNVAYDYFTSAGIVHFANQTAIDILLLRINNGENAKELLGELLGLKAQFENIPYGLGIDYMVNTLAGIAAMEAGQLDLSRQLLTKSARHWQEIGAGISLCPTNLLLSYVLMLQGEENACDDMLRKALSEAEACEWDNFWDWHHTSLYTMCRRAIDKDIHPAWAAHIIQRWFPEQSRKDFSLLLASQNSRQQELAVQVLQKQFKTTGKAVLSVFCFGGFRLFINGLEVESSSWKTKKAESLFKYIVVDRRLSNKEYIMQLLWPDGDPQSSDGKLRMTLSYVRKALSPAGTESVVVHKGAISLNPGFEINCDYEDFMQKARKALSFAKQSHPLAIPALEQALCVYTGEFLPDDQYEDFTTSLRRGLYNLYLEVLSQYARVQFEQNNLDAALQTCYRYLAQEPVDEPVIRMAMNILMKMNRRYKAIELFRSLQSALTSEYNTTPERETAALYDKIQSGGSL